MLLSLFLTSYALGLKSEERSPEIRKPLLLNSRAALVSSAEDVKSKTASTPKLDKGAKIKRGLLWTAEEEERLVRLREEDRSWEELAEYFPGRTWQALASKYYKLKGLSEPKAEVKHWTTEEDETLLELKEKNEPWGDIVKRFPERSPAAIRSHYTYLRRDQSLAPASTWKPYTDEEKELLLKVAGTDTTWSERAKQFPGRSGRSLKSQYAKLKQEDPQDFHYWTSDEEDRLVEELERGKTLEEVGVLLGRSTDMVKKKVYQLTRLGRIQPEQLSTNLPPNTIADFELIREKREEGVRMEDIMRQYFPGRPDWESKDRYRYYRYLKKLKKEKEANDGNKD